MNCPNDWRDCNAVPQFMQAIMKMPFVVTRRSVELNVLYRPRIKDRMICGKCGFYVRWAMPEEAMLLRCSSMRDIFREIELDLLHFVETDDGYLLICAESLNQELTMPGESRNEIENQSIAA